MAESTTVSLKFPKRDTLRECRQFINDLFVSNSGEGMKFIERIQYILDPKSLNFDIKRHILTEEAFSYKYENKKVNLIMIVYYVILKQKV